MTRPGTAAVVNYRPMQTFYIAVKFCHRYDPSPSYIVTELIVVFPVPILMPNFNTNPKPKFDSVPNLT